MGTEFLARIGEVASAALTRLLPATVSARGRRRSRRADARDADIARHLEHLQVERRLAERTLALYGDAFARLQRFAAALRAAAARGADAPRPPLGRAAARRRPGAALDRARAVGLARLLSLARPRRPGRRQPGRRRARAARRAAVAEGACRSTTRSRWSRIATSGGDPRLAARDACIAELLYGCGLRVGELVGLDVVASGAAAGWIDAGDASAHVLGKGSKRRSRAGRRAGAARRSPTGSRCAARSRAPTRRRSSSAAAARG